MAAGGVAVTPDGKRVLVANIYNDSLTMVDVKQRRKVGEIQLGPGSSNPRQAGVAGGEYPFWVVIKGDDTAYVSSIRDREIVVVSLKGAGKVVGRVPTQGNPNKMILNRDQSLLFVAEDNSDLVSVIDTRKNKVVEERADHGPERAAGGAAAALTGSNPNSLALSPDEDTLYVTNGNTSSVAVIQRGDRSRLARCRPDPHRLVPECGQPEQGRGVAVRRQRQEPGGPEPEAERPEPPTSMSSSSSRPAS